jgi:hypothetical protein
MSSEAFHLRQPSQPLVRSSSSTDDFRIVDFLFAMAPITMANGKICVMGSTDCKAIVCLCVLCLFHLLCVVIIIVVVVCLNVAEFALAAYSV